jgi:hypothetical protein
MYTTANGTPMVSSGSMELDVIIIFDEINNDYEILNKLCFDIVEDLHISGVDCLISGMDITDNEILVRIPKHHAETIQLPESGIKESIESREDSGHYYLSAITRSESARQHISEFFDFEQEDMGEPEKEDDIDEALQIKQPNEPVPQPVIEGPESL